MKHEWRKHEKELYVPKAKPVALTVPAMKFFTVAGQGNPNDSAFAPFIEVLYALSYRVRMSPKQGDAPDGYFDYTVYPLEGVWDITDEAKARFTGTVDTDDLVFKLMIRQPDFVTAAYALETIEKVKAKKGLALLDRVKFESIEEGAAVQMLHVGPFEEEPATFAVMESFAAAAGLTRKSKIHREIYLSDTRRVAPEKLKTVLRFGV